MILRIVNKTYGVVKSMTRDAMTEPIMLTKNVNKGKLSLLGTLGFILII